MDVRVELASAGYGDGIVDLRALHGGVIAEAWLVEYGDGKRVVAKTAAGAPDDLFRVEAAGLAVLGEHLRTPAVLAVTDRVLVLEALEPVPAGAAYWEALADRLAALHTGTRHRRFGWHRDGYLGTLPQLNAWSDDGHEFFAERRLLRYLAEPPAAAALPAPDRRALERLCDRLPELVPPMPAVLTHGDLWGANLVAAGAEPVLIDPAVSYTWAEVDLAMLWSAPRPPESDRFFERYQELSPSPPGWRDRMPLLFLRELMSCLAHGEPHTSGAVPAVREILAPFRPR
jgi:fructosamine-3-kinase